MNPKALSNAIKAMKQAGTQFSPGLSPTELSAAEERFDFRFPPELRLLLATAMPTGQRFPNWRDLDSDRLAKRMNWPIEGVCFDVEQAEFWVPDWGPRPHKTEDAVSLARSALHQAPTMIPIYAHRYTASSLDTKGNPVLSMYQSDIIYYGADLWNYLHNEFGGPLPNLPEQAIREIPVWSALIQ